MEKPSTGWLHDDSNIINGDGVFYAVKYIGSIPMGMSMSQVTPPLIYLVCQSRILFLLYPCKDRQTSTWSR